jgi:hypothetical protein
VRGRLAICVLAAGLVGGCGGANGSNPDQVVKTYFKALANGDGTTACKQLTGDAKRQAIDYVSQQLPELNTTDCEAALSKVANSFGEDEKAMLRAAKIASSTKTGNSATVTITGASSDAKLTKGAAGWLIAGGLFEAG